MLFAHAEGASHGGWADVAVRLGVLVPLALVVVWAFAAWAVAEGDRRRVLRFGVAVAVGAGGVLHVLVVREHLRESTTEGVFFICSAAVQLVLAVLVATRRQRVSVLVGVVAVDVGLVMIYAVSRLGSLPFGIGRESFDALGLITKLFEVVAIALAAGALVDASPRRVHIDWQAVAAGALVVLAVLARPLYDLGPDLGQTVAALVAAVATAVVVGHVDRRAGSLAVGDAAAVAIVVRAPGLLPFVVGGALVVVVREVARRMSWPLLAALPVAVLAVLELPASDARLEIFHASHVGDAAGAAFAVAVGGLLAVVAWRERALAPVAAFYCAHLGLQAVRFAAGRTSVEAIEVPAVSLGLLVGVVVTFVDWPAAAAESGWAVVAGLVAGGADVVLRDVGVPYSSLWALAGAVAAVGFMVASRRARSAAAVRHRGDVRSAASRGD